MTAVQRELEEIKRRLDSIENKLELLFRRVPPNSWEPRDLVPRSVSTLPEHLKRTLLTIATMGQANAKQVAAETGRSRAVESDYLNQLVIRGFLKKRRRGKTVNFLVFALYTECPYCGSVVLMTIDRCPICGGNLSQRLTTHNQ